MRLLTHSSLRNPAADAVEGLPLQIEVSEMEIEEKPFSEDFLLSVLSSIRWEAVLIAARAIGMGDTTPAALTPQLLQDKDFLQACFHLLINVNVKSGVLTCSETGRQFPIIDGIPDMMYDGLLSCTIIVSCT